MDLINLSLGTANPDHATTLRTAVDRARASGALLVSAGHHEGVAYLPGSLDGVLSVELDWACPRLMVDVTAGPPSVCRASGYARPVPGVPLDQNLKGLSFAVANVTGVLASELKGASRPSVDVALEHLGAVSGA